MHSTEAIVIRRMPTREHDQAVVLYGPDMGRTMAVAKGSLRATSRQALALDEGNLILCELVAGRGERAIVTGAQAQRCWACAKASPVAWAVAQFFLQATEAIVYEGQPDVRLWAALTGVLGSLDGGDEPLVVLREGQVAVLDALGYGRRPIPRATAARDLLDDEFDRVAQRRLTALDLVYALAR